MRYGDMDRDVVRGSKDYDVPCTPHAHPSKDAPATKAKGGGDVDRDVGVQRETPGRSHALKAQLVKKGEDVDRAHGVQRETALSYSEQFTRLKGSQHYSVLHTSHTKPSKAAQAKVKGAHKIMFSDNIYAKSEARPVLNLETKKISKTRAVFKNTITCLIRLSLLLVMHSITAIYAPT